MKSEVVMPEHLGRFKKPVVTKNDTIVLDGRKDKSTIDEWC